MTTPERQIGQEFLAVSRRQFNDCQATIMHCLGQLDDARIWHRAGEGFNSMGNLLLHLDGNIRQRIGSLIGGEPDTRNRDAEFSERGPIAKDVLLTRLAETLLRTDQLLANLSPERLLETRRYRMLRGELEGSLVNLILHTLVHLGGHTQEIVTLTRQQLGPRYQFMQAEKPR